MDSNYRLRTFALTIAALGVTVAAFFFRRLQHLESGTIAFDTLLICSIEMLVLFELLRKYFKMNKKIYAFLTAGTSTLTLIVTLSNPDFGMFLFGGMNLILFALSKVRFLHE